MIGQKDIVEDLSIQIAASVRANRVLEPVFLAGKYGMGKTTCARYIAEELRSRTEQPFHYVEYAGSEFKDEDDVYGFVRNIGDGENRYKVRFVDEAHTLKKNLVAYFNTIMSNLKECRPIRGTIHEPCTFIFATEFETKIQPSLRSRFVHSYKLKPYSTEDLISILHYHIPKLKEEYKLDLEIHDDALNYIANRSKHIARNAVNFLTKALKEADKQLSLEVVEKMFDRLHIGELGLTIAEQGILYHLFINTTREQGGTPISLQQLSEQTSVLPEELRLSIEPSLNAEGFLEIVSSGRRLSPKGIGFVTDRPQMAELYKQWIANKI